MSICIKGLGVEDSLHVSHGILMLEMEPTITDCESSIGEIYRISDTWVIKVGEREYRVGEDGDIVVNKRFNGLYYTGLSSDEMIGFITNKRIDDRIFVGMLAACLSKGLSLSESARIITELYEYQSDSPSSILFKRFKSFKCLDRLFSSVDRLCTHSVFSKFIHGDVLIACVGEGKALYEIGIRFDKHFKTIVSLSKTPGVQVTEGVESLLCFKHLFGNNSTEIEFNGEKWFCLTGEDPLKLVVELEKRLLEKI